MRSCVFSLLAVVIGTLLVAAPRARATVPEPVRYTVRLPEAAAHYAEVEAVIPTDGQTSLEIFLPVWTPGSYLVREYARAINRIEARAADGTLLPIEKTIKNRWRITAGQRDYVRVLYRLYGREVNIRANWIESDFALFNGAALFVAPVEEYNRSYEVSLELPAGWQGIYTPLTPASAPGRFTAPDYETLVDSPIVAGSPQVSQFNVDGVPFYLVTLGGDDAWDNARVVPSLQRLIEAQRDFWGSLPTRNPYYFFNLLTGSRTGLEHKNSLVLMADRWLSRTPGGVNSWLSLASHEFFHAWNGKRLRPAALGPFDFEHEVYTRSLWIVEGITSYYQHLLIERAGISKPEDPINAIGGLINSYAQAPGRLVQSIGDASFDAWIKAYRPDENSANATVSYYSVGALAGFVLDAEIRRLTHGERSLDDVMRLAFSRYSGDRGYTDAEFIAVVNEVAGSDLTPWFQRYIDTPTPLDFQPALDWFGLALQPAPAPKDTPPRGWLGAETKNDNGRLIVTQVRTDTPALRAGLDPDDEILAIDHYRVRPEQLASRLGVYRPGEKITLLVARLDRLLRLEVTLGEEPPVPGKLVVRADSTAEQTARRNAWLHREATK